ncbi:AMP-binding protein, partial [Mycobacteroides abscessus]|nr:AMP-binding protein [Mycobacteroides abscessus]
MTGPDESPMSRAHQEAPDSAPEHAAQPVAQQAPAHPVPPQYLLGRSAPAARTLIDILYATAAENPDAPAIDDGTIQLTYSELIVDMEASVEWLGARGIGRGDRVGIRMPSGSYSLYVAILATLAAGAAYVPVDADDPDERAALVFGEAQVAAVITPDG